MELDQFRVALDRWLDEHEAELTPGAGGDRSTPRWRTSRR